MTTEPKRTGASASDEELFEQWRSKYTANPMYTNEELDLRNRLGFHAVPYFAALRIERERVAGVVAKIEALPVLGPCDASVDCVRNGEYLIADNVLEFLKELRNV